MFRKTASSTSKPSQDSDWVVIPDTPAQIEAVAKQCRRLVTKRALVGAGVALVPVPGLDWVTDIGILMKPR